MDIENAVQVNTANQAAPVSIRCSFDSKIFHNATSKYCVVRMKTADTSVPAGARAQFVYPDHLIRFTAIGHELPLTDSVDFTFEGTWIDGKYGLQLQVDGWHEIVPPTEAGVLNYLSSGLLKNVGERTAEQIVSRFGVDSLRIIEEEPHRLLEIRGITEERLEEIKNAYAESSTLRGILTLLAPFKLTPKAALKIYNYFGTQSIDILKKSPYALCQIPGYGFLRVDAIMQKNNCDFHDPMRVRGALHWAIEAARSDDGHLFLDREVLIAEGIRLLNNNVILSSLKIKREEVEKALKDMILDGSLVSARNIIYHPKVFAQEDTVANVVAHMLIEKAQIDNFWPVLEQVKTELGIKLSPKQEDAVKEVFRNNLSVITGSPGTGKTTVLKVILEVYARLHPGNKVNLLAPTGRASRKMAESTGYRDAKTMHNALGLFGAEGDEDKANGISTLDADLIIVDECSMIDMWLAGNFFPRIKKGTKVVLVGDPDQLPPVGAGKMFREIIDCGIVPVTVLDQIFRQAAGSFIAHNAKIINMGETKLYYGDDFVFIPAKTQEDAAAIIMELYCQEIQQNSMEEIQILSPFRRRGDASADNINQELREIVNPFRCVEDEIRVGNTTYRVGDRVMQTKNTKQASNGDLGYIRSVDTINGPAAEVDFGEGRKYRYKAEELLHLELSYATTVHKAQGGEYDTVLMPILKAQSIILSRNLLYTAITRAKKRVFLVGQKAALFMAIHSISNTQRNTMLGERICLYYRALAKNAGIQIPLVLEQKLKKAG